MRGAHAGFLLIFVTLFAFAAPAFAQAPDPNAAEAVALARGAKERYDQGKWSEALTLFEQAEAKAHSPVLLLYSARCHRNLGQLVRARELYLRVIAEVLPAKAPDPFRAAQRDAKSDLDALEPRIGKLAVDRSAQPSAVIEIDGAPWTATEPAFIDPGKHVLVAKADGKETSRQEFLVREGETVSLALAAGAAPPKAPPPDAPATPPIAPPEPDRSAPASAYAPGIVLMTLGAGGLAAGIATRVIAFQKVSDVKERCEGNVCPASAREDIESAETFQTASTVALVAGGAAAVAGVVLLVVLPAQSDAPAVSVRLGPTGAFVTGTF